MFFDVFIIWRQDNVKLCISSIAVEINAMIPDVIPKWYHVRIKKNYIYDIHLKINCKLFLYSLHP